MKEQVKVLINSKKEAKQVKAILKGLGENVFNSVYSDKSESYYYSEKYGEWCIANQTDGNFTTEIKPSDLEEMTRALSEINNPS